MKSVSQIRKRTALIFLIPVTIILLSSALYPLISTLYLSLTDAELENFLNELSDLKKIKICGLMIIPNPNVALSDLQQTFKKIKMLADRLIENYENLTEISMGMSRDFELAIKEGSTIVRLGETIFGARN